MESTLIVIPALNEEATIAKVLCEIANQGPYPVLVVNDGSTDGTANIAREHGAKVFNLPIRLGAWGAMQTGLAYAKRQGYARVITMDADGQHEPRYFDQMLARLQQGDCHVVIGACTSRGSQARHWAWAYFRRLTGFSIEDLTSGFRLYDAKAIALLAGREATLLDYQDIGVLLLLRKAGLKTVEIPVEMLPRQRGKSRIFYSWGVVVRYMLETSLLCLAHWHTPAKSVK